MSVNARRLLTILHVLSGGREGVAVDREAALAAFAAAVRMTDDEFDRAWAAPARAVDEATRAGWTSEGGLS